MDKKKLGYRIHHCAPLVWFSHSVTTEQFGDDKFVYSDDVEDHDADETHMPT